MTAPEEPRQPAELSPQAADTEQALEAAEGSIAPIITGIVVAAAAQQALDDEDSGMLPGMSGIITRGALFTPSWVAKTFAQGMRDYIVGSLMTALHPIVLRRLTVMLEDAPTPMLFAGPNLGDVAHQAATDAVDAAVERMIEYADSPRARGADDIYDMFGTKPGDDPRSAPQRRAEGFGARTARWITREAIFRAQEKIAPILGYNRKRWLSERDSRVRHEHVYLDGKVKRIGEPFEVQGQTIRYPGDITAPPHLVINCRCSLEWLRR